MFLRLLKNISPHLFKYIIRYICLHPLLLFQQTVSNGSRLYAL